MYYVQPPAELSEVDPRFSSLPFALQTRVVDVMLTVDRVPMRLAVDAVLMTERNEDAPRNNRPRISYR